MNWFVLTAGVLYLGAFVTYIIERNFPMAGAFFAYAVANFCLMMVRS